MEEPDIFSPKHIAPLGYFLNSAGLASHRVMVLGWVFGCISAFVCILISILVLIAALRRRPEKPYKDIERSGDGLSWIYIGTGISIVVLFAMMIYMLLVLNQIARPPTSPGLTIAVTGYDWWWKADYANDDPEKNFTVANEIHIPVGVPVALTLNSADVIHAFWVPLLAGKTQMIPGQTNRQWIEADKPGIYRGQCTQFCGAQHAHMSFEVIADTPEEFAAWENHQRAPADATEDEGEKIFMDRCSACHTVRGTAAAGIHAPDLTHLASRQLIAAGLLTNTPGHLADWIQHAQEIKPGARMPDFALSPAEVSALTNYLETLQ